MWRTPLGLPVVPDVYISPERSSGVGRMTGVSLPLALSIAVAKDDGSPLGALKQNDSFTNGTFGSDSFHAFMKISCVLQNSALHCESLRMYVQSLGSWVSYIGTIAAFIEYEAAASAAHSHRLLEMIPILSCGPIPVCMWRGV